MPAETLKYQYRVDAADVVVWVDRLWLAFAQENGAAELTHENVVGRSLWKFITGDDLCRLYQEIHARVRSSNVPVMLPFRCDSPLLQRHMRLTITLEAAGHLSYECILVRAVPQRALEVLDVTRQRGAAFLTVCSCCKRALLESVGWLDLEDVAIRLRLFEASKVPELRHTVCPECTNVMLSA